MEINKQEILEFMRDKIYKPLNIKELETVFELEGSEEFKKFIRLMNELEETGEVVRTRTNNYGIPEKMNLLRGKILFLRHLQSKHF